jgi:hypothetical protein
LTKKRNKTNGVVWFWASECKYDVIINRVKQMGWKAIEDEKKEDKCNIFWVDVALIHERLRMAQPWQIVNHFPGMPNIARKNRMGQNLNKFQKLFPVCTDIQACFCVRTFRLNIRFAFIFLPALPCLYRRSILSILEPGFSRASSATFGPSLTTRETHWATRYL